MLRDEAAFAIKSRQQQQSQRRVHPAIESVLTGRHPSSYHDQGVEGVQCEAALLEAEVLLLGPILRPAISS
jgi:hypothetical protein